MTAKFTWTEIYHELAVRLLEWRNRQQELLEFLESLRSQGLTITPLLDRDADGQRFRLDRHRSVHLFRRVQSPNQQGPATRHPHGHEGKV